MTGWPVIAVVDDEESVRKAIVRLLQAAGYIARGFGSGNEFLASRHFDPPDCLVLDLQMPGFSGMDVQRALNRAGEDLPIVIITAHHAPSLREECMREGAVAYLSKPLDEHVLLDALNLALGFSARPPSAR
jgi:FixJ family two-component response regulator